MEENSNYAPSDAVSDVTGRNDCRKIESCAGGAFIKMWRGYY